MSLRPGDFVAIARSLPFRLSCTSRKFAVVVGHVGRGIMWSKAGGEIETPLRFPTGGNTYAVGPVFPHAHVFLQVQVSRAQENLRNLHRSMLDALEGSKQQLAAQVKCRPAPRVMQSLQKCCVSQRHPREHSFITSQILLGCIVQAPIFSQIAS